MAQLGLPSPTSRPTSSYSGFNLGSSSSSSDGEGGSDDDAPLPFPTALARRDFLAPDFDPASYLSALHTGSSARHQTLEDLRSELRDRSTAISAELLELVNSNYTSFLSLGDELKGGEERVEDVRVALLGFRRAVEEVQSRVRERRVEVTVLDDELQEVKDAAELGREMLELDERVAELEARLAVGSIPGYAKQKLDDSDSDSDDEWADDIQDINDDDGDGLDEGSNDFVCSSPSKLATLAQEYVLIGRLSRFIGLDLPFVKKIEERIIRCRNTILLDLSTAMKEARRAGTRGQGRVIRFLGIYRTLDANVEAVRVLKEK
ncbi:oligomeric golgi complex component, COG2-domain-containing protein [Lasiosphaeria miniovina]|uniref:Conserved oligomeric Golgi complex subunit 2 n=1 Tax=Lasiosphaeria miniovina TaxID=1954250 RepID=A0AA40B597_9PEZI|nr:oligomeric golgi complex component, COG2-domain-containing protein [Lasiosphaeria miniovina]KAK0727817.1 oligomeric golgi complex component, COG2-domain-containing protein [Lasiosphaeria miniovina]